MPQIIKHKPNTAVFMVTIVDPTGVPIRIDIIIPVKAHITESMAELIVTAL